MVKFAALGLCLLWASPRVVAMPRFSWDTIQTFAHCSNHTGPLSDLRQSQVRQAWVCCVRERPVFQLLAVGNPVIKFPTQNHD